MNNIFLLFILQIMNIFAVTFMTIYDHGFNAIITASNFCVVAALAIGQCSMIYLTVLRPRWPNMDNTIHVVGKKLHHKNYHLLVHEGTFCCFQTDEKCSCCRCQGCGE